MSDPTANPIVPQPVAGVPVPMPPVDLNANATPVDPLQTNNLAGPILQQLGTPDEQPAQMVGVTGSLNKEGFAGGLPAPTEIPISSVANLKESAVATNLVEAGASSGPVEVEPARELEPEVEALQEKIAQHKINGTEETAVRADSMPQVTPNTVAQPVVVLPLTEKGMNSSKSKNTVSSARWLYEWCVRQIRRFKDTLVVYRDQ